MLYCNYIKYCNVNFFLKLGTRTPQVISTSSNLTVLVSASTAGRYRCRASTPGFDDVNAEVTVFMKSAPAIKSPGTQHGTPTDTVRLECIASSVPIADRIVWTYHGTVIGTRSDQNYYSVSKIIMLHYYYYYHHQFYYENVPRQQIRNMNSDLVKKLRNHNGTTARRRIYNHKS